MLCHILTSEGFVLLWICTLYQHKPLNLFPFWSKLLYANSFFKGRYFSVEHFDVYKKNKDSKVYKDICGRIGVSPDDCIFVDDSYSNLEFAKEAGMTTVRIYYKNNSTKDKEFIDYAYKGIESFLDDII